jgi:hypothetical protein
MRSEDPKWVISRKLERGLASAIFDSPGRRDLHSHPRLWR